MARLYNFETNSYEEVPEEHIREGVLSKKYAFSDKEKIPVIAPDGTRHLIPGLNAREAFQRGGNYGSTKDWERIGRKEEYGEDSWENYLGATLTGAARGATVGLSDVVLRDIIGKERMQTWREEFAGPSIAGEIGGAILPTLFTGGGAAGATAARLGARGLAKAPAAGVFKAGKYLEDAVSASRVLSRGADKNVAVQILRTSLPKGMAGVLEGAAFGAGTTLTESMLGDPEDVSELLLANVGWSALFGGLGNAGVNAAMMTGAAGTKKISQGMASLYKKTTGNKLSVAMQEKIAKTGATLMGRGDPEHAVLQTTLTPRATEARGGIRTKMGTFKDQTDDLVGEINGVVEDLSAITGASRGEGKRVSMRPDIFDGAETSPVAALDKVRDTLSSITDMGPAGAQVDLALVAAGPVGKFKWLGKSAPGEVTAFSGRLEKILQGDLGGREPNRVIAKWVEDVAESGEDTIRGVAEDAFLMLDDFKKFTGDYIWGPGKHFIDPGTVNTLQRAWGKIHPLLEDAKIWGKAAVNQKSVNAAFNDLLPKMNLFKKKFGYGGTDWTSTKKVRKFLEKFDDDPELEAVYNQFLESVGNFTNISKGAYKFTDDAVLEAAARLPKRTSSAHERVHNLKMEMDEARFMFGTTGLNAQTEEVAARLLSNLGRKSIGGLVGGAVFGGPGAAIGVLLGGLADGAATANQLAAIEYAVSRSRNAIEKSLDGIVERMTKGGPGKSIPARPNRTKLFLAPLAAQFGEELSKEETSKAEDYRAAKQRAMNLADPQALGAVVNKITEDLSRDMPNVSAALQAKMTDGLRYVSEGFNKDSRTTDDLVMGVLEREPTDSEKMKMEIRLDILEDPVNSFLGSIENRTCNRTHSEAMQKLWPKLFGLCQAGYYERISNLENRVPFIDRQVATIAFNRPHDVSYKPENVTTLQASYGEKSEEGGKIKSTPLLKTHFGKGPTEVEKVMA